jgi:hypothetical protein
MRLVVVAPADGNPLDWPQVEADLAEDIKMKKVIFGGMLLALLSGVCFAQRGGARMGSMGPDARTAPNVRMGPDARPFPDARHVGPAMGGNGSNVGVGTHAKTVGPNIGQSNSAKTVGPNVGASRNAKTVSPDAVGAGATADTVDPNAGASPRARTVGPDAGPAPQSH